MQPMSAAVVRALRPQPAAIRGYQVELSGSGATLRDASGARYRLVDALGGKNVYYFLTPLDRGRLQVAPVAYDVRRGEWFDTTASGVRHMPGGGSTEAEDWHDRALTFNTSCYGCHVSQFAANYDAASDTYHTTWSEPGINCDTCHGSSAAHVAAARALKPGAAMPDPKLIVTRAFTPEQHNSACAACHAKLLPLVASAPPGSRFFDNFDLVTYEDADYYPDGRDLGENYTYTSWLASACARGGRLHCVTCHTSSGRYRFAGNEACAGCHEERVRNAAAHTHHAAGSAGNRCVACHMPETTFARMTRHDHSMLPPAPAATMRYGSPNACNGCHRDRDAAWADRTVRQWFRTDYQAPVLRRAGLIDAARRRDWTQLPAILAYVADPGHDAVVANSLVRLLDGCPDERKWPVLLRALGDASPLVRSSAAAALHGWLNPASVQALETAANDDYRVVRIRAAASLAGVRDVERATSELLASLEARPDDVSARVALSNFYMDLGDVAQAAAALDAALRLDPDNRFALLNASSVFSRAGQDEKAREALLRAARLYPADAAVNLNLGMLLAEDGKAAESEAAFRRALAADPASAQAAYNLSVLLSRDRPDEALAFARTAVRLRPNDAKYRNALAYLIERTHSHAR